MIVRKYVFSLVLAAMCAGPLVGMDTESVQDQPQESNLKIAYEISHEFLKDYGCPTIFATSLLSGFIAKYAENPGYPMRPEIKAVVNFPWVLSAAYVGLKTIPEAWQKGFPSGIGTLIWDPIKIGLIRIAGFAGGLIVGSSANPAAGIKIDKAMKAAGGVHAWVNLTEQQRNDLLVSIK